MPCGRVLALVLLHVLARCVAANPAGASAENAVVLEALFTAATRGDLESEKNGYSLSFKLSYFFKSIMRMI